MVISQIPLCIEPCIFCAKYIREKELSAYRVNNLSWPKGRVGCGGKVVEGVELGAGTDEVGVSKHFLKEPDSNGFRLLGQEVNQGYYVSTYKSI